MGLLRNFLPNIHPKKVITSWKNPTSLAIFFSGLFIAFIVGILFRNQLTTFFQTATGADPVAYWKFDEGVGSTANDSVGTNPGTLGTGNSAPVWVNEDKCISGKCLYFDGTNDKVEIASNTTIGNLTSNVTVSAWIRLNSLSGTQRFFGSYRGASHDGFAFGTLGSNLIFTTYSVKDYISSSITLNANRWYYVAAVLDSSYNVTFYVDGKQIETVAYNSAGVANIDDIFLIGTDGSEFLKGYVDEIKVYNYARTPAQIKADYSSRGTTKGVSAQFGESDLSRMLTNGLVGYWKMDEVGVSGSNWTATDSSGNGNNGSGLGNATVGSTVPGKFGNGGYFDGNGDYLSVPYSASLAPTSAISFGGWFKVVDKTQDIRIVSKTEGGGYNLGFNDTISSSLTATVRVGGSYYYVSYPNSNISNGTWYHAFVTYDGETVKLYVNGSLVNENTNPSGAISYGNSNAFCIGGEPGNSSCDSNKVFIGSIDEIRVYNRALSAQEVYSLYSFAAGPVGWWKMDEGVGSTAIDSSSYGNNGTLASGNNSPGWSNGKFGKALSYDGVDDFVSLGSSVINGQSITVSLWINLNEYGQYDGIVDRFFNEDEEDWSLLLSNLDGKKAMFIDKSTGSANYDTYYANTDIPLHQWTYLTLVADNGTYTFYMNGKADGTGSYSDGLGTTGTLYLGANFPGGDEFLNGQMDDLKIYNYARTQAQIVDDMNANHPAPGSPVGHAVLDFPLDEGYGATLHNEGSIGSTLNGILGSGNSAPTWTNNGKFGKALSFDGNNDFAEVVDNSSIDPTDVSISAWIKLAATDGAFHTIAGKWRVSVNQQYLIQINSNGKIGFWTGDGGNSCADDLESIQTMSANTWYHILGTQTGTTKSLYINGKLNSSQTSGCTIGTSSIEYTIGGKKNSSGNYFEFFNGVIDEVKVYPFALTADQVKAVYAGGSMQVMGATSTGVGGTSPDNSAARTYCPPGDSSTCNAPVGEWNFEEGVGGTANDTSGNGNVGSLGSGSSAPTWTDGKLGKALNFSENNNGTPSVVTDLDFTDTQDITYSIWFKWNGSTGFQTLFGTDTSNAGTIRINSSNGTTAQLGTYWDTTSNTQADSNFRINKNVWYYLSVVKTSGLLSFYLNGYLVWQPNINNQVLTNIVIGKQGTQSDRFWNGIIDNARIYNYARTPAQVAWEYNRGASIAEYKLDECSGTTIYDTSENKLNGTLSLGSNGVTSAGICTSTGAWANGAQGKYESSMSFDGSDDYVTVIDPSSGALDMGANDFSVSAWIKTSSTAKQAIVVKGPPTTGIGIGWSVFKESDGQLRINLNDGTLLGYSFPSDLDDNSWHFITVTFDRDGNATGYVDSKIVGTVSISARSGSVSNSNNFYIGRFDTSTTDLFNGQIDDIKIFDYVLTPAQVKTNMAGGAVRFE